MAKKPVKTKDEQDEQDELERARAEEREEREHPEDRGPPVRSHPPQAHEGGHPLGSRNGTGGGHGQEA